MQTRCVMINPSDPFGAKVGGSETFLNGLIEFAPEDIAIDYVGISADPKARPLQKWTDCRLGEKAFRFFPVLEEKNENRKTLMPLTLRFASALYRSKPDLAGAVLFFNRFEPALLYRKAPRKTLIVHNDVKKQLDPKQSEVFWRFFPRLYFFLEKKILATMDQIYAVSQNTVDFCRSVLSFYFSDLEERPGLHDYLMGRAEADAIITATGQENLSIIRSQEAQFSAPHALRSDRMKELVRKLKQDFDVVIFDTPPVLAINDAVALGELVDMRILVIEWGKTSRDVVQRALKKIAPSNLVFAGIILNKAKHWGSSYYYDHYYDGKKKKEQRKKKD